MSAKMFIGALCAGEGKSTGEGNIFISRNSPLGSVMTFPSVVRYAGGDLHSLPDPPPTRASHRFRFHTKPLTPPLHVYLADTISKHVPQSPDPAYTRYPSRTP